MFLFGFTIGILSTIAMAFLFALIFGSREVRKANKLLKEVDKAFESDELKFHSRVKEFVYISGYKYTIVYMTDLNKISLMDGLSVVLSHQISGEKNGKIAEKIKGRFTKKIFTDITVMNGISYSNNLIQTNKNTTNVTNTTKDILFDTDIILDKISAEGYDSLTDEEKKWLDNQSKQ